MMLARSPPAVGCAALASGSDAAAHATVERTKRRVILAGLVVFMGSEFAIEVRARLSDLRLMRSGINGWAKRRRRHGPFRNAVDRSSRSLYGGSRRRSEGVAMKSSAWFLAVLVAAASFPVVGQPPPQPPPPPCTPAENVVCGQQAPEDLVALGPQWVAAGAYSGSGGVVLIRVADRASHTAYPSPSAVNRPDARTYPGCPGAPGEGGAAFTTHGVYVAPGNGPVHKLFVVGHGARESIEVFEVDTRPGIPAVAWLGCVVAPEPIGLNSVRGLPDGGFITTNFLPRGGTREATQRMLGGERNGELWEWHTASGWQKVPGSEAAGANGVELSDDGKTLYVAAWGSQSFFRLSRGVTPPVRDEIPLGFRVDNIHWARDGSLFAVGQAGRSWKAVKIDPRTLAVRDVVTVPDTPEFGAGTALVEVGDKLWVGSFRGNRIAIVPAP